MEEVASGVIYEKPFSQKLTSNTACDQLKTNLYG